MKASETLQPNSVNDTLSQIENSDVSERLKHLTNYIDRQVRGVLRWPDNETLDQTQGFFDLGMDSLMAVELSNHLRSDLGQGAAVSAPTVFDYPTVERLTQHIAEKLQWVAPAALPPQVLPLAEDAIAIVGIGCRFPAGADNPEEFWRILSEGTDGTTPVPADRWHTDTYYDPDPQTPGKMYVRKGGFIKGPVDRFDEQFFGISPREAEWMDPQQRLLLEVTWEALEHASIDPLQLQGTTAGVYIGVCTNDYGHLLGKFNNLEDICAHWGSGNSDSIVAGRLAYFLGTQGPCLSIDTACSSSLVAVHNACASLHSGESDCAIAGGVNLMLTPEPTIHLCKSNMLSPDEHCKTFDAAANGFIRGEGCGVVVLKRLSDARRDGNNILAIIRSTSINQDGASSGLTVPNGAAQARLIRNALQKANLSPSDIHMIEAHGTGTALGDPIEVGALNEVFTEGRPDNSPLVLGSVKTNIGHLEAAAGVAGLIKTVLSLQHETIPAHLHLKDINAEIGLNQIPAVIPTSSMQWQRRPEQPRRAGVSSFGFSGTNAHIIIEEAPLFDLPANEVGIPSQHLVTISAKTESALTQQIQNYALHLRSHHGQNLADVAYTTNVGRSHFERRAAVVGQNTIQLAKKLTENGYISGSVSPGQAKPKVAFLFTGQGSVYSGMGRSFYETQPVFRETVDRLDSLFASHGEAHSLTQALFGDEQLLSDPVYGQAAIFAVEYALAQLWQSFGVTPNALIGHSLGEYALSVVAGVMSLESALTLVVSRARLLKELPQDGGMVAVKASAQEVKKLVDRIIGVEFAAANSPHQTVLSGKVEALDRMLSLCDKEGIAAVRIPVTHAFHSVQVEPILERLRQVTAEMRFAPPTATWISTVTGKSIGEGGIEADYWVKNTRSAVQFQKAIDHALAEGCNIFIEIGPKPQLLALAMECADTREALWLPSLKQGQDDWTVLLESVAKLYVNGVDIDWVGLHRPYQRKTVQLPTYPFQRKRHWLSVLDQCKLPGVDENTDRLFHDVIWRSAGRLHVDNGSPLPIVSSAEVQEQIDSLSQQPERDRLLMVQRKVNEEVESLCIGYICHALQQLGFSPSPGDMISLGGLRHDLGIIERHQRLLAHCLRKLGEAGILEAVSDQWRVVKWSQARDLDERNKRMVQMYREFSNELRLLARCGKHLAAVWRGTQDPLSLLFDDASAEDLYHKSPSAQLVNPAVQLALQAIVSQWPEGKTMRILEIGAGTGGSTSFLLPQLPAASTEYIFTDVSPLFLDRAKTRFEKYEFVNYQLLDIELDPKRQGFAPAQFDVVIAANVLHATRDLKETVQNVRHLLKPGGYLILREGVSEQLWSDLTFGLLGGWWRFDDLDLRPHYPLLSASGWLALLKREGFRQADLVRVADYDQEAIVCAQATVEQDIFSLTNKKTGPTWVILADDGGVGESLALRLRSCGESVLVVHADVGAQNLADGNCLVSAINKDAISEIFVQLAETEIAGVIHMWGMNVTSPHWRGLDEAQHGSCGSVLYLVQSLIATKLEELPRLWLVTQGAQALPGQTDLAVMQSPIVGLSRVIAVEYPKFKSKLVDLDTHASKTEAAELLFEELWTGDNEEQVVLRQHGRYVGRLSQRQPDLALVRTQRAERTKLEIRSDGTYLITGGLGGLGLEVAAWLVNQGARYICLVGRRAPSTKALQLIKAMQDLGANIEVHAADVGNKEALRSLLDSIRAKIPPIRGVFHAAGVAEPILLTKLTWQNFQDAFLAKVYGTWYLHELTLADPLDCFVLFSSLATLLGSAGEGHYSAANAFLDGLSHYRQSKNLPALSINWGAWSDVGMAAGAAGQARLERGIKLFTPAQALKCLHSSLEDSRLAQVGVAAINWQELLHEIGFERSWLTEIRDQLGDQKDTRDAGVAKASSVISELDRAGEQQHLVLLRTYVEKQVRSVLKWSPNELIDPTQGFFQLGMDSLMAVEFANRLRRDLGERAIVSAPTVFDHSTIEQLSEYLAKELGFAVAPNNQTSAPHAVSHKEDSVAIVGIGCRFPGGATDPDEFWKVISNGVDAISPTPEARWNTDHYNGSDSGSTGLPGNTHVLEGGFLHAPIDGFDSEFFAISPREAEYMDPQQRLLLEVAWEALEHAGLDPTSFKGTSTGVFIGVSANEYGQLILQHGQPEELPIYWTTGNAPSMAAGRLAYVLGLQGPCLAIDTACSSSLVAVHNACTSLLNGECDGAIAGGVNLMLTPQSTVIFAKGGMPSPDNRCKTFDAGANGFVRGEGCGIVVLKRLSDAV
ncbi:MAG TPA: SDR family NAD(P)-dependent oxidoreductase, partial [Trichormus sp.]